MPFDDTYYCANCESIMQLDRHLRCSRCGSDAIDIAVRPALTAEALQLPTSPYIINSWALIFVPTIQELEKLYEESR